MRKSRLMRRVLLPLAMLGVLAVGASNAQAWTLHEVPYGPASAAPGKGIAPPCCSWTRYDVTGNIAIYDGAGTVSVCQLSYDLNTGISHNGCGNNAVGNALNLTPWYGHAFDVKAMNNSPYTHTIRGVYYYGNP